MFMTSEIRALVEGVEHRRHALPLWDAIVAHAKHDARYAASLAKWLTEGGTIVLRDELASKFQHADFIKAEAATGRRYPWVDAWAAIDSAMLQARTERQMHSAA